MKSDYRVNSAKPPKSPGGGLSKLFYSYFSPLRGVGGLYLKHYKLGLFKLDKQLMKYIVILLTSNFLLLFSSPVFSQEKWNSFQKNIVDEITTIAFEGDIIWLGTYNGLARYNKTTGESIPYTKEDGLIHNEVNDIAIDQNGVKWIVTNGGISRFDGVSFTSFSKQELGYTDILGVAADSNNIKWFISQDAVLKYDDVSWHVYTLKNGLPAGSLTTIAIDTTNTVWIGTNKNGILSFDGNEWILHEEYKKNIVSIAIGEDNTKWFGDFKGSVISYNGEIWDQFQVVSSMWFLYSVAVTPDNSIWASTNFGLYRIENGKSSLFNEANGLIESYCRKIVSDSNGDIWIAGYLGLTRFDGIQFTNYLGFTGPLNATTYSIAVDNNNVKWFGHNNSVVSSFDDPGWSGFALKGYENIGENIVVDTNNVKWFSAGWDGAVSYDNTKIETLEINGYEYGYDKYYSLYTRSLTIDSNNTIYFATSRETYDDLSLMEVHAQSYKYDNAGLIYYGHGIVYIDIDSQDTICALMPYGYFYSRNFGIYCYDGTDWNSKIVAGETGIALKKLYVDRNDCIWGLSGNIIENDIKSGLTGSGLLFYDGIEWTVYTDENSGLVSSNTFSVIVDHSNIAWIGTDAGVSRFDGETWTTFTTENSGLCDNKVNAIAVEKNNTIWFGTDNGVSRYTGEIIATGVDEDDEIPEALPVINSYPNPFNPTTTIEFTLPESGFTTLSIYNISGQIVRELAAGYMTVGTRSLTWDGRDDSGETVSSGIYITRLVAGKQIAAGRMILLK